LFLSSSLLFFSVCADLSLNDVVGVCLAMSGVNNEEDAKPVHAAVVDLFAREATQSKLLPHHVLCFNDSRAALAAGTYGKVCSLLCTSFISKSKSTLILLFF
jgi:hypothetical protein